MEKEKELMFEIDYLKTHIEKMDKIINILISNQKIIIKNLEKSFINQRLIFEDKGMEAIWQK